MSIIKNEFGASVGAINDDIRFIVGGQGAKNALAITCSYESAVLAGAVVTNPAFQDGTFYGRILVTEGNAIGSAPVNLNTLVETRLYLDLALHGLGPYTFLFPLGDLQGQVQTSQGGILTVVLAQAFTAVPGQTFRGRLSVAGQTLIPGRLQ